MEQTTVNRMNLLLQKDTKRINSTVPGDVKELMEQAESELKLNEARFIKLCIIEKLDRMYPMK